MTSTKGNLIKNQYVIVMKDGVFFQSYEDIIAFLPTNPNSLPMLDAQSWDSSITTRGHREVFLGEPHVRTLGKINAGKYLMVDLNEKLPIVKKNENSFIMNEIKNS